METENRTWYDKHSKLLCNISKLLSLLLVFLVFSLMGTISIGKLIISAPEFKEFYGSYVTEQFSKDIFVLGIAFGIACFMFLIVADEYNQRRRSGVVRYNMALIAQIIVLCAFIVEVLVIYKRLDVVGIIIVLSLIYYIFVLVNVNRHYFANQLEFAVISDGGVVALNVILMLAMVAIAAVPLFDVKDRVKTLSEKYAAKQYGKMIDVLFLEPDEKVIEYKKDYIALQYVNLFNDEGRIFTPEEMEEAVYNVYYNAGSWYSIMEYNELYDAIEEKYDFSQYFDADAIEGRTNDELYRYLVYDKLAQEGINNPNLRDEVTRKKVDEACIFVHDILITGKPLETIGESGDVITVTYDGGMEVGQKVDYSLSHDYDLTYSIITRWARVPYVGSHDEIEFSTTDWTTHLEFQDNSVYRATIAVYPEVTYKLNTQLEVEVKGLDYEDIEYEIEEECIKINVWMVIGDEEELSQVKYVDTVEIGEIPGLVLGGNVVDRTDPSEVSLSENILCQRMTWQYFDTDKNYYKYCNPNSDSNDSVKTFAFLYPIYRVELKVFPETGYTFSEELKVTYNGTDLELIDGRAPLVDIAGYYKREGDGQLMVCIYFNAAVMYGEKGIVTGDVGFAAKGTVVTMNPQPDEGYKLGGYDAKYLTNSTPEDPEIVLEGNKLYMKTYPVEVQGIFVKE